MGAIISVSFIVVGILGFVFGLFFFWKFPFQIANGIKIEYECPSDEKEVTTNVSSTTATDQEDLIKRQSILTKNPLITIDNRVSVIGGLPSAPPTYLTVEDKLEGNLKQNLHSESAATSSTDTKELKFEVIHPEKPFPTPENVVPSSIVDSEFQFHDANKNTVQLISFDNNTLRIADIWSPRINQLLPSDGNILTANNIIQQFEGAVVPSDCIVRIESVPLQYFTHCILVAETTIKRDLSIEKFCELLSKLRLLFENNFIYFASFFVILALILCFYAPFTMLLSTASYDDNGAYYGQMISGHIFAFTVISLIFYSGFIFKSRSNKVLWFRILILLSLVLMILVLSLSSDLLSISLTYHSSSGTSSSATSSSGSSSYWNDFLCYCSDTSSRRLTDDGSSYSFVCDNAQSTAASGNDCAMDCGVCGQTYWSPFLSYTVFATLFALTALAFAFVDYWGLFTIYSKGRVSVSSSSAKAKINTHMVMVLHGSKSFGYPVRARLSFADALVVEKKLRLIQHQVLMSDNDTTRNGRDAALLPHFAAVGSSPSLQAGSIFSTFSSSFESLAVVFQTVLTFVLNLILGA